MTDFVPLRDRLSALRRQVLVTLAEQLENGALDAGLPALLSNVQTALTAVEETIAAERQRPRPTGRA